MKKKNIPILTTCHLRVVVSLGLIMCSLFSVAQKYTTLKLPKLTDGSMITLVNWDNEQVIDSLPVRDEVVVFRSDAYPPSVVKVMADYANYGNFILSDDIITLDVEVEEINGGVFSRWEATGGYNDTIVALQKEAKEIQERIDRASSEEEKDSLTHSLNDYLIDRIDKNADNLFGFKLFMMVESRLPSESLEYLVAEHPDLRGYEKVRTTMQMRRNLEATVPGNSFKDFIVSYEGTEHRLGDVAGKGEYVLLDFWAFWCGPCRKEMPFIKDVYDQYKDRNFKVIGVAISDDAEKDLKAAKDLELPWEIWVNGRDAIETYSIKSIPHLILIGPDGTILERGFRSENILPTVEKYLENKN